MDRQPDLFAALSTVPPLVGRIALPRAGAVRPDLRGLGRQGPGAVRDVVDHAAVGRAKTVVALEVRDRALVTPRLAAMLNASQTRYSYSVHGRMPSIAAQTRAALAAAIARPATAG